MFWFTTRRRRFFILIKYLWDINHRLLLVCVEKEVVSEQRGNAFYWVVYTFIVKLDKLSHDFFQIANHLSNFGLIIITKKGKAWNIQSDSRVGDILYSLMLGPTFRLYLFYFIFLRYAGLSLLWPLPLRSTGSGRAGSAAMAHGPSRSAACGILPDRGTNPCPLHRQEDSQPLRHQGSPPTPDSWR